MRKILFLLMITFVFGQDPFDYGGWSNNNFIVPGTSYAGELVAVDESSLGTESLTEGAFATHVNWDVTNDFDDTGGNAAFIWSANQTSTLTQTQANLAVAGVGSRWYVFTYTLAVTTAFDGDAAATITTGFALSAVSLEIATAGTYTVYFTSAAAPTDFVISLVSGSDTEGTISYDDLSLKEIQGGDVVAFGKLKGGGTLGLKIESDGDGVIDGDFIIENAEPSLEFKDTDATDGDESASIAINDTDTGSGTEDTDVLFSAQVAGADVGFMSFDADGDLFLRSGGGSDTQLVLDSGGDVGIGTTSPSSKLEVVGEIAYTAQAQGVTWDESADTYTRTGSIADVATGVSAGSDRLIIQSAMRRVLLNDAGEVTVALSDTNSAFTEFGVAATIDGTAGQVMVEIPKFYYKYSYSGTTHNWSISPVRLPQYNLHPAFYKDGAEVDYRYIGAYEAKVDVATTGKLFSASGVYPSTYRDATGESPAGVDLTGATTDADRAAFRTYGSNRGAGWRQLDYDLASAVQLLYLIEYADFNSQSMIGNGRTTLSGGTWIGGSYIGITGLSNGDGNGTNAVQGGVLGDTDYMTYRGIENFFGNVWSFIDGININNNIPYVSNDASNWADDTATDYTELGITLINANGYQSTLEQMSRGFLPASVGASSSTKITDYYYQSTGWRVFLLGGSNGGSVAGVFCAYANSASSSAYAYFGGRVCF